MQNNIEFIQKDFTLVINEKLSNLQYLKQWPIDLESYINIQFNKWLKEVIFLKPNGCSKREKEIADKLWRNVPDLNIQLSHLLRILGFKNSNSQEYL